MIKMVMALRHGVLPTPTSLQESSPHVDWDAGEVRVLASPWTGPGRASAPRRRVVWISGTNAHLLLEEAPPVERSPTARSLGPRPGALPFLLSGSSEAALEAQSGRLRGFVEAAPDLDASAVGGSRWRWGGRSCRIARWRSPRGSTSWGPAAGARARRLVDGLVRPGPPEATVGSCSRPGRAVARHGGRADGQLAGLRRAHA